MPNIMDQEAIVHFPILIGDIGGTNARFAILVDAFAQPKEFPILATADFGSIEEAIQVCVLDKTSVQPRAAIFAIAGPVDGDEIQLTNCPWVVRPKQMMKDFFLDDVIVLNDFEAQALAAASLDEQHRHGIGGGAIEANTSRVVLGPGTGLGVAGLVYSNHNWIPVPGEGGHIDLGPRTDRDFAIFPHLEAIGGRISAEQILCGSGMVNLYRAICKADEVKPAYSAPHEITGAGLDGSDPLAAETLSLFATFLGRVAGDLALVFMARGGVFLSGGIAQKIIPVLEKPEFRAAFEDKAPHEEMMRSIPTCVITHPLAALFGLASFARTPVRFGVATEGRRWRA
ncbi:glucokinase [Hoeflea prorocentri]|uniref:Glucokinase n=1 Tax=Hoeflea prorocentri TaxID=1922333 RepID=A0A9X3UM01_9HYPH|nr:glucokinase [Hoeflea prorocentri]MCY6383064.1 glucokinase [Hoeflea prorocentri]MDA5400864.1 glucokinase [Hoeflea prorocentri]